MDVKVYFLEARVQHFTLPLSDIEEVRREKAALVLQSRSGTHRISLKNVSDEDAEALHLLFTEAVSGREEQTRRAPEELVQLVQRRKAQRI